MVQANDGRYGGFAHGALYPFGAGDTRCSARLQYPSMPMSRRIMSENPSLPPRSYPRRGLDLRPFMRLGYGGASTAQIARLARVSKRDLYAVFNSKQAMLCASVMERTERMRHPLNLPAPGDLARSECDVDSIWDDVIAGTQPARGHGDASSSRSRQIECARTARRHWTVPDSGWKRDRRWSVSSTIVP